MKYYTFYRESNKFDDIISDANLKQFVRERISWTGHYMIGINEYEKDAEKIFSYITLKYGDEIRTNLTKDYRPIPNKDYTPKRN
jgi:hypothetical protein